MHQRQLEVCLSPDLIGLYSLENTAVVVIDVLRATSCMVTALAHGVKALHPVSSVEECQALGKKGYITAGERNGQKVDGFDLGNSPYDYMEAPIKGKKVAVTTTNGTRALHLSQGAPVVLVSAFLNLEATIAHLRDLPHNVLLFCAGWKGRFNLEDTLLAGAIAQALEGHTQQLDDAALAAKQLYQQYASNLPAALKLSAHAQRLAGFGVQKDLDFCAQQNIYSQVPVLHQQELRAL